MGARWTAHRFRVVAQRNHPDLFHASRRNESATVNEHGQKYGTGMVRVPPIRFYKETAMSSSRIKNVALVVLTASLLAFGCKKRVAPAPPPPPPPPPPPAAPPPPPAPAITLRANPTTIDRGQNTTLTWEAKNAASVRIEPGLGDVGATGNRSVNPASSVTYQ